MSDHHHHDYADARHDHREYAAGRHDHDLDYAERHHRHHDDERTVEELRGQIRELRAIMIEFGLELSEAQGRIHQLEQQTPEARQLQLEADQAAADLAESGYDRDDSDEDDDPKKNVSRSIPPFAAVPRLRRVTCTRTVTVDGNPEPCGLPVDHDPDEKCAGNPHARPAPHPREGQ